MLIKCPDSKCNHRWEVLALPSSGKVTCPNCKKLFVAKQRNSSIHTKKKSSVSSTTLPSTIGRFAVQNFLGAGAFGKVFRAHDPELDRDIALKLMPTQSKDNARQQQRFLREAKAAARLRHPHIVAVFDAGVSAGQYYLASAFIEGTTLSDAVREEKLDLRRSAIIARQLAQALAYAHRKDIVHRDVKSANVMIDSRGDAFLMDFGLASRQDITETITAEGAVIGTPAYMAPEQAQGQKGKPLPASDQYSLGIILYEMICGQLPFIGPPATVIYNAIHTEPKAPRAINQEIPLDLERICLKAIAKDPEDRYESCQALADDLRRWLDGEPVKARKRGIWERAKNWCKREPKLALATGIASFCLLAVVVVPVWTSAQLALKVNEQKKAQERAILQEAEAKKQKARADEELKNAKSATLAAAAAIEEAEKEKRKADEQRKRAEAEKESLKRALLDLERSEALLPRFQYVADVNKAFHAIAQRKTTAAKALLDAHIPKKGEPDFRSFAWYHLSSKDKVNRHLLPDVFQSPLIRFEYSFDGKKMFAMTDQLETISWDLSRQTAGKELKLSDAEQFSEQSIPDSVSPNGQWVFTMNTIRTMELTDLQGKKIALNGHKRKAETATWSTNGRWLVTFHPRNPLCVWDTQANKPLIKTFNITQESVLAISSDGQYLASSTDKNTIKIYEIKTGKELQTIPYACESLAFTPDSKFLIAESTKQIKLWNIPSATEHVQIDVEKAELTTVTADSSLMIIVNVAKVGRQVIILNLETKKQHFFPITSKASSDLAISTDGKWLASIGRDRRVLLIRQLSDGQLTRQIQLSHPVHRIVFDPKGTQLAVLLINQELQLLPDSLIKKVNILPDINALSTVDFKPASTGKATAELSGKIVTIKHPSVIGPVTLNVEDSPNCLAITSDGSALLVGFDSGQAQIFDMPSENREPRSILQGHKGRIVAATVTPDGKTFVTGDDRGMIKLWEVVTGQELLTLKSTTPVKGISFSADGTILAVVTENGQVQLWYGPNKNSK